MTEYIVLRKRIGEDPNTWEEMPGVFSGSPRSVCKFASQEKSGTYVAVPARSWKPLPVKVEQTTKVTIG